MVCVICNGAGRVPRHPAVLRAYGGAWMTEEQPCSLCNGTGVLTGSTKMQLEQALSKGKLTGDELKKVIS